MCRSIFVIYYYGDQIKDEIGKTYNTHGENKNAYNILAGKLQRRD